MRISPPDRSPWAQGRNAAGPRRRRSQLCLEALEDRWLPSTVSNLFDAGPGSLRQAILDTPAGGTVDFQPGLSGRITLTTGQLTIDHDLTITGPGASILTVSGNNMFRVFEITSAVSVTMSGLTIANGLAAQGGGIFTAASTLTISDSVLSGNRAVGANGTPGAPGAPGGSGTAGQGGGIFVLSGTLVIDSSMLLNNQAIGGAGGTGGASSAARGGNGGSGGGGLGGGIYATSGSSLTVCSSTLSTNRATGGNGGGGGASGNIFVGANGGAGGIGQGGAIYAPGVAVQATNSILSSNRAVGGAGGAGGSVPMFQGGSGGPGGAGGGGGIFASSGSVEAASTQFEANQTVGGAGGAGGTSFGLLGFGGMGGTGAMAVGGGISADTVTFAGGTLTGNVAEGGRGGNGGFPDGGLGGPAGDGLGGGLHVVGSLTVSSSTLADNQATGGRGGNGAGPNGNGGAGRGGGIWASGTLTVISSALSGNRASGGAAGTRPPGSTGPGGTPGSADGGGLSVSGDVTIGFSTISGNQTTSQLDLFFTSSSNGGGGLFVSGGTVAVSSSTLSGNEAAGQTNGGAIKFVSGSLAVNSSTITANQAPRGGGGILVRGSSSSLALRNTIVAANSASSAPDVSGPVTSQGHNLIGIGDGGSGFQPSDLVGTAASPIDPQLEPLGDYGGPTPTHRPRPTSPAVNAGDNTDAPATDQRGLPRIVGGTIDIGAVELQPADALLTVIRVRSNPAGFVVTFSQPIEPSVLNLYDGPAGALGPADVVVLDSTGNPVSGSLVIAPGDRSVQFIKTGGPLPAGTYTITLRSAADGFRMADGTLLDGNSDGTPGDDYVGTLTVSPLAAVVVGIPDFARGPDQAVNVPATAAGLPLTLSASAGITAITLTLRYDPALLRITGITPVTGATASVDTSTPGMAVITFNSSAPLSAGVAEFARLTASVPHGAPYKAKAVLDLTNIQINGGAIPATDDDGLEAVVYFGDTSANGALSSADATRALQAGLGLGSGFAALPLTDPLLIADITGNGILSSTDATRILQKALGLPVPQIPDLPPDPPVTVGTIDPLLRIPRHYRARPGGLVGVPVRLDFSEGLQAGDLALSFDTARLEVVSVQRGSLTRDFDLFAVHLDAEAGSLRVGLGRSAGPLRGRGAGSVLRVTFRVKADAPAGGAIINLRQDLGATTTQLNDGDFVLNPAPSNEAGDVLDGLIRVRGRSAKRLARGRATSESLSNLS